MVFFSFKNFFDFAELLSLISTHQTCAAVCNVFFTVSFGLAAISSFLWAISFEHVVSRTDVKLTQSAMRNEFYKSRNAMAYYGPPTCVEMTAQERY